ncbi:MAG: lysine--tRNA ligase [Lentisphaerae bacterium]|nr:lysine--tRNA ligase [Lentisphaerota bacterium]
MSSPEQPVSEPANIYREQRLANMRQLEALGQKPFGHAWPRSGRLAEIRAAFEEGKTVSVAGRLMTIRGMGKAVFADLYDGSGRFQLFIKMNALGEDAFQAFKLLDLGDQIGVEGRLFVTRMGEQTIEVHRWALLSKALLNLPEKWHGLQDTEERYRKRYLDLIANPESRDRFNKRIAIIREIRSFLDARGFQEVETPMMQPQAGGAAARPFITRHNALACDMVMRIAPELYLKRLLVGGFDKVYELGKNFRNEGLDRTHNPEFTVLEVYEAYGDRLTMKALIEGLIPALADTVLGARAVTLKTAEGGDETINLAPPYREVAYADLIRERMGADWFETPLEEARQRAVAAGLDLAPGMSHLLITHEIYDKLIERTLRQPTFVTRLPKQFVPLAKACADDPVWVDVFEFVVAGKELCPGYSENNDPIEQRQRFAEQVGENPERIDEDFLTALEHGMPPAGGMGIGIDRLVMLLTATDVIRDVILFPQLKQR